MYNNELKNKAMNEYWEYQAVMAGQSSKDENNIKIKFKEVNVQSI